MVEPQWGVWTKIDAISLFWNCCHILYLFSLRYFGHFYTCQFTFSCRRSKHVCISIKSLDPIRTHTLTTGPSNICGELNYKVFVLNYRWYGRTNYRYEEWNELRWKMTRRSAQWWGATHNKLTRRVHLYRRAGVLRARMRCYLFPLSFVNEPPYLRRLPSISVISGIKLANIAYNTTTH